MLAVANPSHVKSDARRPGCAAPATPRTPARPGLALLVTACLLGFAGQARAQLVFQPIDPDPSPVRPHAAPVLKRTVKPPKTVEPIQPTTVAIASVDIPDDGHWDKESPEFAADCQVPGPLMCGSTLYLNHTRCGRLQLDEPWTCYEQYAEGMQARESEAKLSIIDPAITAAGLDYVIVDDGSKDQLTFTPDALSYTSQYTARTTLTGASNESDGDLYELYRDRGVMVNSCQEYVAKRTWGVSALELAIGDRQDLDHILQMALEESNEHYAIATQHAGRRKLYDMEGRSFGRLFSRQRRYKNAFMRLPKNPRSPTGKRVNNAPDLRMALASRYGLVGLYMIGAIENVQDKKVEDSWAYQRALFNALSTEQGQNPSGLLALPAPEGGISSLAPEDHEALSFYTGVSSEAPRRYLNEELNELSQLQDRYDALLTEWGRLNVLYKGSGWQPSQLVPPSAPEPEEDNPGGTLVGNMEPASGTPVAPGGLIMEPFDPETHARRRVVEAIGATLQTAIAAGCIADGMTPCDGSPRELTHMLFDRFAPLQDQLMNDCRAFAGGATFNHLLNLDIDAVSVTPYWQNEGIDPAEYNCRIETDNYLTLTTFESLQDKNRECIGKLAAYEAHKQEIIEEKAAQAEALANISSRPELKDENGELKPPGKRYHWSESKGNKYFGVGLTLDAGYAGHLGASICNTKLSADALFDAYSSLMGREKSFLRASADVDTGQRYAKANVELGGKALWGVDASWGNFDAADDFSDDSLGTSFEVGGSATIVIAVVPVSFGGGIAGNLGLRVGLNYAASAQLDANDCPTASVGARVEPYANLEGFVSVSIDAKIVELGVRGRLTIVEASLPFSVEANLAAPDVNAPGTLDIDAALGVELETLSGRVELYGRVGFCPFFCWKGARTIASWDGLQWEATLIDHNYTVNLPDLARVFSKGLEGSEATGG